MAFVMTHEMETKESEEMVGERYEIKNHLASGGTADVYIAYDSQLRRQVIIKRLKEGSLNAESLKQIWAEASKMASLRHSNVVAIYDVISLDGSPCIVMEHLAGESIEQRADQKVFDEGEFIDLARQSLEGLIAAHHAGMIHRDLKPSNIMLVPQPSGYFQVKLLDFGMAKFVEPEAPSPQTVSIDGSITGSIYCISPEQLNHEPVDVRSDLYSLGCTFYYALTGKFPFTGERVTDVITAHLTHNVLPLQKARPDISPALARWVMSLFQRKPAERYASAKDSLLALEKVVPMSGTTGRLGLMPAKKSHVPLIIAACVLLVGVVGAAAFFVSQQPAPVAAQAATPSPTPSATPTPPVPPAAPIVVVAPTPEMALATPTPAPVVVPAVVPDVVFRLTGSNTIGSVVGPALIKGYMEFKGYSDTKIETTDQPTEKRIVGRPAVSDLLVSALVAAHGSGTAFKDLAAGATDAGMSSRPIKPEEAVQLSALGDMQSVNCEHVIGLDGLAIIVNRSNPVAALSVAQVAAIFQGSISDWSEVGGLPGPITRYGRNEVSGTFDSFQSLVLGKEKISTETKRFEDSSTLSDEVAMDAGGIGFIGLPYVRRAKALAISEDTSPPLLPSPFTVATEDYALSRRLYLYTAANPTNRLTTEFVEFVLSPAGQAIVEKSGFVSQTIEPESTNRPDSAPKPYLQATENAKRLNVTLRFKLGSTQLDGKAQRDVVRIMDTMARPENRGKQLLLLGFSDSRGSASTNTALSGERARVVAKEFVLRGIHPALVQGFGDVMPVATNQSEQGRSKNRRVEVWVRD